MTLLQACRAESIKSVKHFFTTCSTNDVMETGDDGQNCLEVAIEMKKTYAEHVCMVTSVEISLCFPCSLTFVYTLLYRNVVEEILESDFWKDSLRKLENGSLQTTPFRKLIKEMPGTMSFSLVYCV